MGGTTNNTFARFEKRFAQGKKASSVCYKCGIAFVEQEFIYRKRTGSKTGHRVKTYHKKCWEATEY